MDRRRENLYIGKTCTITPIAFRDKAHAKDFLKDSENVKLIKQYLMLDDMDNSVKTSRRRCEIRSHKGVKAEYAYIEGIVTYVSSHPYCWQDFAIKVCDKSVDSIPLCAHPQLSSNIDVGIIRSRFTTKTAPRAGDTVLLRSRKTIQNPSGLNQLSSLRICDVISRKRDI